MKVYLASPFFNPTEREIVKLVAQKLREGNVNEVYVPMEHEVEDAWSLSNDDWAKEVFKADVNAIDKADVMVFINFGMVSDSGSAWECGYAYAKGINVLEILVTENDHEFSLMCTNGCKRVTSLNYFLAEKTDFYIESIYQK